MGYCKPYPLISIVVLVLNAGPYLNQALASLMGQTYGNLEIICLNDDSTDDSLAIMQRLAAEDVGSVSKVGVNT